MVFRAAFLLLPIAVYAQIAPPEVDQALRARVTEFFQYHVDGEFEKAFDLVANDTKKYYFGAQKIQFKSFKIDSIKYADDFKSATVTLTCQQMMRIQLQFPATLITTPMSTTWKIEDGKWVWHRDAAVDTWLMPMGPTDAQAAGAKRVEPGKLDLSQEAIEARARAILQQSNGLNKGELKLSSNKPSSDEAAFHNGQPGQIRVGLITGTLPPGLTAKLDKTDINGGEDAILKVHYDPQPDAPAPQTVLLKLVMEPFSRTFPISVKFEPEN
jgi:hypothetical protein